MPLLLIKRKMPHYPKNYILPSIECLIDDNSMHLWAKVDKSCNYNDSYIKYNVIGAEYIYLILLIYITCWYAVVFDTMKLMSNVLICVEWSYLILLLFFFKRPIHLESCTHHFDGDFCRTLLVETVLW
jgi:hypothetical protein